MGPTKNPQPSPGIVGHPSSLTSWIHLYTHLPHPLLSLFSADACTILTCGLHPTTTCPLGPKSYLLPASQVDPKKSGFWPRFQRLYRCHLPKAQEERPRCQGKTPKLCLIGLVRVRSSSALQAWIRRGPVWGASFPAITLPTFLPATLEPLWSASSPLGPARQGKCPLSHQSPALPYARRLR